MKRMILAAAAAILMATPALAQDRAPVWHDVAIGMTSAEVKALYPDFVPDPNKPGKTKQVTWHTPAETFIRRREVMPGCVNDVGVLYESGIVKRVEVNTCNRFDALTVLKDRYGKPTATDEQDMSLSRVGYQLTMKRDRWVQDGLSITLENQMIIYEAAPKLN